MDQPRQDRSVKYGGAYGFFGLEILERLNAWNSAKLYEDHV